MAASKIDSKMIPTSKNDFLALDDAEKAASDGRRLWVDKHFTAVVKGQVVHNDGTDTPIPAQAADKLNLILDYAVVLTKHCVCVRMTVELHDDYYIPQGCEVFKTGGSNLVLICQEDDILVFQTVEKEPSTITVRINGGSGRFVFCDAKDSLVSTPGKVRRVQFRKTPEVINPAAVEVKVEETGEVINLLDSSVSSAGETPEKKPVVKEDEKDLDSSLSSYVDTPQKKHIVLSSDSSPSDSSPGSDSISTVGNSPVPRQLQDMNATEALECLKNNHTMFDKPLSPMDPPPCESSTSFQSDDSPMFDFLPGVMSQDAANAPAQTTTPMKIEKMPTIKGTPATLKDAPSTPAPPEKAELAVKKTAASKKKDGKAPPKNVPPPNKTGAGNKAGKGKKAKGKAGAKVEVEEEAPARRVLRSRHRR